MSFKVIILYATFGLVSGGGVLPDSVNAAVGDTVMFPTSLTPTQTPFISIAWDFGETNIISSSSVGNFTAPEYESRISLFISNGSLELKNVALIDTGDYRVSIFPTTGVVENGITTLNVYERITNIYVESSSNEPIEGSSLNLTCDASGSISTRKWLKNGQELNPSENIVFYDQNRVLSFKLLNRKDSGKYLCEIGNPISSERYNCTLDVNYGPENVQISGLKEIQVKETLKLTCLSDSVPTASYTWIKNGTVLTHSSEYTKSMAESSDSGEYICRASNEITTETSEASYTVLVTVPSEGLSAGAIAGITVAVLVVVAGAAVGGFYLYKHLQKVKQ